MAVLRSIDGLKQVLSELDFPVDKDRIVVYAQDAGADEELLSALQSIPAADYNEPNEILRAVPTGRLAPEPRTESDRTQQRREHTKPGMSEQAKETRPVNPIEEELGENRKS
ncbi:MAG: DUF2795 domain-containing protein [Nocardiopsaceae bacterium]|nr:DUF2795 domain-containing protein [Nocardiopsaceae bacterium]